MATLHIKWSTCKLSRIRCRCNTRKTRTTLCFSPPYSNRMRTLLRAKARVRIWAWSQRRNECSSFSTSSSCSSSRWITTHHRLKANTTPTQLRWIHPSRSCLVVAVVRARTASSPSMVTTVKCSNKCNSHNSSGKRLALALLTIEPMITSAATSRRCSHVVNHSVSDADNVESDYHTIRGKWHRTRG